MDASNGLGESNNDELRSRRYVQDPSQKTLKQQDIMEEKPGQKLTKKQIQNKARTLTDALIESFGQCTEEAPNQSVTEGTTA